jgi:hypothetical protein
MRLFDLEAKKRELLTGPAKHEAAPGRLKIAPSLPDQGLFAQPGAASRQPCARRVRATRWPFLSGEQDYALVGKPPGDLGSCGDISISQRW